MRFLALLLFVGCSATTTAKPPVVIQNTGGTDDSAICDAWHKGDSPRVVAIVDIFVAEGYCKSFTCPTAVIHMCNRYYGVEAWNEDRPSLREFFNAK